MSRDGFVHTEESEEEEQAREHKSRVTRLLAMKAVMKFGAEESLPADDFAYVWWDYAE